MNLEIKKGKGIEGLVSGYIPQIPDEARQITESRIFQELEEIYRRTLECPPSDLCEINVTQILTPEQINAFLQTTTKHEEYRHYTEITGVFISRLIQNSYENGHNGFTLNTTALKEINNIGYDINGGPENIEITIVGNTGNRCGYESKKSTFNIIGKTGKDCGRDSKYSTFNITGNPGDTCGICSESSAYRITGNTGNFCGLFSNNSTYIIQGNTGNDFGSKTMNSTFDITGNTGPGCGTGSENSTFTIAGDTKGSCGGSSDNSTFNITRNTGDHCGYGSKNSTYKTSDKETLEKMMGSVPEENRVIFSEDGTEVIMRDFDD